MSGWACSLSRSWMPYGSWGRLPASTSMTAKLLVSKCLFYEWFQSTSRMWISFYPNNTNTRRLWLCLMKAPSIDTWKKTNKIKSYRLDLVFVFEQHKLPHRLPKELTE
jgi:hypothetical protein